MLPGSGSGGSLRSIVTLVAAVGTMLALAASAPAALERGASRPDGLQPAPAPVRVTVTGPGKGTLVVGPWSCRWEGLGDDQEQECPPLLLPLGGGGGFAWFADQGSRVDLAAVQGCTAALTEEGCVISPVQEANVVRVRFEKVRCECEGLDARVTGFGLAYTATVRRFGFTLRWELNCTGGTAEKDCRGDIKIQPRGVGGIVLKPASGTVNCNGSKSCKEDAGTASGKAVFRMQPTEKAVEGRAGKTWTFVLRRYCLLDGARTLVGTSRIKFVFGQNGAVDKQASDLNGDGSTDG